MKKISIYTKLLLTELVAIFIFYKIKISIDLDWISQILAISAFLFGILIAFSIANRHSRLDEIRTKLREQDAYLLDIYFLSKRFGRSIASKVQLRIDELLLAQIDYRLTDFDIESPKKLRALFDYIEKCKPKNKSQVEAHEQMLYALQDLLKIQETISYRVKNNMMIYEWINLILLGGIMFFCFLVLNDLSLKSIIILSVFTSAIALLFLVLKEIESLEWQEKRWIWSPLTNLFEELELTPYFPQSVFDKNRLKFEDIKSKKIRIAKYPFPYPNMKNKKIVVIGIKRNSIKTP